MKYGVAQYGMNLWYGGFFDLEDRLAGLKKTGYEATEMFAAVSPSDALHKASLYRKLGMSFACCSGPNVETSIRWTAGLGGSYIWVSVSADDFDAYCTAAELQGKACEKWGIKAALHNHLDTPVETEEQIEEFLKRCPSCGLVLDTAHLALAEGDPVRIAGRYAGRIAGLHIKDWLTTNPEVGMDMWIRRGRFCELGAGNIGMDNAAVLRALADSGYDGWVFVEQDTHLQDPLKDLAVSLDFMRSAGF